MTVVVPFSRRPWDTTKRWMSTVWFYLLATALAGLGALVGNQISDASGASVVGGLVGAVLAPVLVYVAAATRWWWSR